ncbi:conserved hypothetical protein [metagenome]|uniref:Uncharacterized protein n=1 Tax=metagenome TaxID=256318 RepID=A0A2P2CF97_9ZZZZ
MKTGSDVDFDRKLEQIHAARERQEAKHAKGLLTLLNGRDDLRGVHALADMVGERVLWCA